MNPMAARMDIEYPTRSCTPLTDEELQAALAHIAEGYSITSAARLIHRSRQALYDHMQRNPDFRAAINAYHEEGTDTLEDWMLDKARDPRGFLANIATLKARRPEKWRDTAPISTGPTVNITINAPSPGELRSIIEGDFRVLAPQQNATTIQESEPRATSLDSSIATPPGKVGTSYLSAQPALSPPKEKEG